MTRGLDWFDAFREMAPDWSVVLLGLVTQLGDVWFLGLLVGTVYWTDRTDRDEAAAIVGIMLSGLSLITALKAAFALPRPERVLVEVGTLPELVRPLYEATTTATGYGFPSGHALMSTVVYLTLAEYWSVGTRRRRYLVATSVVIAVCFSRIGLGVHYFVDVVAGAGAGLAFLLLTRPLLDRYPTHRGTFAFAIAVGTATVALVVSEMTPDAVLLFGASLGAFAGWQFAVLARAREAGHGPIRTSRPLTARAIGVVLSIVVLVAVTTFFGPVSLAAQSIALGAVAATFVAVPVVYRSEQVRNRGRRSPTGLR